MADPEDKELFRLPEIICVEKFCINHEELPNLLICLWRKLLCLSQMVKALNNLHQHINYFQHS